MTLSVTWANNASTTLAAAITNTATSITLLSGSGADFPSPSSAQFFPVTLISATNSTTFEIVYCTARSGDTLTVIRGQESTTALAFNAGDLAQNLVTAGTLNLFEQSAVIKGMQPVITDLNLTGGAANTTYSTTATFTPPCNGFIGCDMFVAFPGSPGYVTTSTGISAGGGVSGFSTQTTSGGQSYSFSNYATGIVTGNTLCTVTFTVITGIAAPGEFQINGKVCFFPAG